MTYEYVANLHAHSVYSDGEGVHDEIARAAILAGLDLVAVTDHNVLVEGLDGYRYLNGRRVLLVTAEEIHDQLREPQKNHLLVFEAHQELAALAPHPQRLLNAVNHAGGMAFIAHPVDPASTAFRQPDLSWVDWDVDGYAGIEIWNFGSEFKSHLSSLPAGLFYAFSLDRSGVGPFRESLALWDRLLGEGRHVVGFAGADAHGAHVDLGPLHTQILPYEFLYRAVNMHLLTEKPLQGDAEIDRRLLFDSLRRGRSFVGYDLASPTRGFRFAAAGDAGEATMGESIRARFGVTLQARLPQRAEVRLVRHGALVRQWAWTDAAVCTVTEPGAYRLEAYLPFKGRRRGWIFSNPIYITD